MISASSSPTFATFQNFVAVAVGAAAGAGAGPIRSLLYCFIGTAEILACSEGFSTHEQSTIRLNGGQWDSNVEQLQRENEKLDGQAPDPHQNGGTGEPQEGAQEPQEGEEPAEGRGPPLRSSRFHRVGGKNHQPATPGAF